MPLPPSLTDPVLTALATARLTRLVVHDDLGQWWVRDPLDRAWHEHPTWQKRVDHKYLSGLTCPFCVGFWIGAGMLAADAALRDTRAARPWRYLKATLALNYLTAHLGTRLGDAGWADE